MLCLNHQKLHIADEHAGIRKASWLDVNGFGGSSGTPGVQEDIALFSMSYQPSAWLVAQSAKTVLTMTELSLSSNAVIYSLL